MRPSILHHLGEVKGKNILDLASGDGDYLMHLLESGASRVTGSDLSEEILELSRRKLHQAGYGETSSLSVADASEVTTYADAPFNAILCNFVICYSANKEMLEGFCKNIASNLSPGGHCVLTNSQGALPIEKQKLMQEKFGVEYALLPSEEDKESFSHGYCKFPNGWTTEFFYIASELIEESCKNVGLQVERVEIVPESNISEDDPYSESDVSLLKDLVPFQQWILRK